MEIELHYLATSFPLPQILPMAHFQVFSTFSLIILVL